MTIDIFTILDNDVTIKKILKEVKKEKFTKFIKKGGIDEKAYFYAHLFSLTYFYIIG